MNYNYILPIFFLLLSRVLTVSAQLPEVKYIQQELSKPQDSMDMRMLRMDMSNLLHDTIKYHDKIVFDPYHNLILRYIDTYSFNKKGVISFIRDYYNHVDTSFAYQMVDKIKGHWDEKEIVKTPEIVGAIRNLNMREMAPTLLNIVTEEGLENFKRDMLSEKDRSYHDLWIIVLLASWDYHFTEQDLIDTYNELYSEITSERIPPILKDEYMRRLMGRYIVPLVGVVNPHKFMKATYHSIFYKGKYLTHEEEFRLITKKYFSYCVEPYLGSEAFTKYLALGFEDFIYWYKDKVETNEVDKTFKSSHRPIIYQSKYRDTNPYRNE